MNSKEIGAVARSVYFEHHFGNFAMAKIKEVFSFHRVEEFDRVLVSGEDRAEHSPLHQVVVRQRFGYRFRQASSSNSGLSSTARNSISATSARSTVRFASKNWGGT